MNSRISYQTRYAVHAILMIVAVLLATTDDVAARQLWRQHWPPELYNGDPDWRPGDELLEPVSAESIHQVATATLRLADEAIAHVDAFIAEARPARQRDELDGSTVHDTFEARRRGIVADYLSNAGDAGTGINSLSTVRTGMSEQRAIISVIAERYRNPVNVPREPNAYRTFLAQQTEDIKAIHHAVRWFTRGRDYVVQWVLLTLRDPDDGLIDYQRSANAELNPKIIEIVEAQPDYDRLSREKQLDRRVAAFESLRHLYADGEKELVERRVAQYFRMAQLTQTTLDEMSEQLDRFVKATPAEWADIPFGSELYRWIPGDVGFYGPFDPVQFGSLGPRIPVRVSFCTPEDVNTPLGTATNESKYILDFQWKVAFVPPTERAAPPARNLTLGYPNQQPVEYPRFVFSAITRPPFTQLNGEAIAMPKVTGQQAFFVFIVGQDIVDEDGTFTIDSWSFDVHMHPIAARNGNAKDSVDADDPFESAISSLTAGWSDEAIAWCRSLDAAFVLVDVEAGTLPGAQGFIINGVEGEWILRRGTIPASMTATRSDWINAKHPTDVVYHFDEITIEVTTGAPIMADELEVIVLVDDKPATLVGMSALALKRRGSGRTFTSDPIRIAPNATRAQGMNAPAIVAPEYAQITLVTDFYSEFTWQPATSLMTYVTPARMKHIPTAGKTTGPARSYLWKEALQTAATLAGRDVNDWGELSVQEAGEVSNFIITELGDRKVSVTIGQHAAMILMRRLFIEQMELYLATLPKATDGRLLNLWAELIRPHANDPTFGPALIEVTVPYQPEKMTYGEVLANGLPDLIYWGGRMQPYDPTSWYGRINREAYLGWRAAVIESLKIAQQTRHNDIEAMVELTGQGFNPVARMLIPRLVKLEERGTPAQLVWVPDEQARLTVQSIETLGQQALAIEAIADADTTLVVAVASLGFMAPATIPTKILCLAIEAGMALEAGALVHDYFDSRQALQFALGSSVVLDGYRLSEAEARAIPGWGATLAAVGSIVGLGSETHALVATVRAASAMKRARELLPQLESGGLDAFLDLGRDDQVTVLTAITAAKADRQSLILRFDPDRTILEDYGSRLQQDLATLDLDGTLSPPAFEWQETLMMSAGGARAPRSGNVAAARTVKQRIPNPGDAFRIQGPDGPEDIVIGEFLGNGAFSQVFKIEGDSTRVIKFCRDAYNSSTLQLIRTGRDSVLEARRVHALLKERGIPQLDIQHFAPDVEPGQTPYMIQEPMIDGEHIWFDYTKRKRVTMINGVRTEVSEIIGVKSAAELTPDGKLPPKMQEAVVELFHKLATARTSDGQLDPLVWEDGHMKNIFLVREGDGFRAGILDQDRLARFADISDDKWVDAAAYVMGHRPRFFRVESLAEQIKPDDWLDVMSRRGSLAPTPEFFMAKMLEYSGRYIKYNRTTGEFERILIEPSVVEKYFPQFREWVDPDLRHLKNEQSMNRLRFPVDHHMRPRPTRIAA